MANSKSDVEFNFDHIHVPSTFSIVGSKDNQGGESFDAAVDFRLPNDFRFLFQAGTQKSEIENVGQFKSRRVNVGLQGDRLSLFTVGGGFEFWGILDEISYNGGYLKLFYRPNLFDFELVGGVRKVDVTLRLGDAERKIDFQSKWYKFAVTYIGLKNTYFKASHNYNWYERDISLVSSTNLGLLFSPQALQLSSQFITYSWAAEVGYSFPWVQVSIGSIWNKSAYDNSKSRTGFLGLTFDIYRGFGLGFEMGRSQFTDEGTSNDDEDDSRYGSVILSFQW